jgi:hypothetical protein
LYGGTYIYFWVAFWGAFGNDFLVLRQYDALARFGFQHWREKQYPDGCRLSASWQEMKRKSRGPFNDSDVPDHKTVVEDNVYVGSD